ncbi:ATP-binding protein [Elusimicrobiota bacterium]
MHNMLLEERLKESEEKFAAIIQKSPIPTAVGGTEGSIVFFNEALEKLIGYKHSEIKDAGDWAIKLYPDKKYREYVEKNIRQALSGQEQECNEFTITCKDGIEKVVDFYTSFYKDGLVIQMIDVTERKRSDNKIKDLAKFPQENANPVYRISKDGVLLYANPASRKLILQDQTKIGNKIPERWIDMVRKVYNSGKKKEVELEFNGRIYLFEQVPVIEEGYVNSYGIDITERKRAEDKLKETLIELERSNKELEYFAYVVSHDLQEPLRMVSSYLQLINNRYKDKLDKDADEFIGFAVDGAKRMQAMVRDLLQYSRAGKIEKELVLTDCEAVFNQAKTNLRETIRKNGAEVTCDSLPIVMADSVHMNQLFQNLISNAIKYRREEAPVVHVSVKEEGDKWQFTVKDNGIGFDNKFKEKIFTFFQRLEDDKKYQGTGIGLAICKRIVESFNGRIWAESEVGRGSLFHFELPMVETGTQEK